MNKPVDIDVISGEGWTTVWYAEPSRLRRLLGRFLPYPLKLRVDRTHMKVVVSDVRGLFRDAPPPPTDTPVDILPLYEGPRCASCGGDHFPDRGEPQTPDPGFDRGEPS